MNAANDNHTSDLYAYVEQWTEQLASDGWFSDPLHRQLITQVFTIALRGDSLNPPAYRSQAQLMLDANALMIAALEHR